MIGRRVLLRLAPLALILGLVGVKMLLADVVAIPTLASLGAVAAGVIHHQYFIGKPVLSQLLRGLLQRFAYAARLIFRGDYDAHICHAMTVLLLRAHGLY